MLYVIPFILLLIIAVVLKKREDANKEKSNDRSKKISAKKTTKNTSSRATRTTQAQQSSVSQLEAETASQSSPSTINPELKNNIENLIGMRDYSSAEAKINQALNQDNSQHQLYLYLVDIHAAQKDEFAIKQVINYLRSLGLHEIADQADLKYKSTVSSKHPLDQASTSTFFDATSVTSDSNVKSNAAFDALIESKTAQDQKSSGTFDRLQSNLAEPEVDHSLNTIDYETSHSPAQKKTEPVKQDQIFDENFQSREPLDFSFSNTSSATLLADVEAPIAPPDKDTQTSTPEVSDNTPLEFSFTPKTEQKVSELPTEDFIFSDSLQAPTQTEVKNEFKLDFDLDQAPVDHSTAKHTEFNFKLDTPVIEQPTELAFETRTVPSKDLQFESNETIQTNTDPLAQAFPELLSINDIALNLQLVERYIELGAYDSAKTLLNENQDQFSPEQRQLSQNLLNRIAS